MGYSFKQVDAFTETPFRGNPAAVFVLREEQDDRWLGSVAAEMNLPETAYLVANGGGYALRWFTPTTEVDLCGHATLASAHVLWEDGHVAAGAPCRFETRSGVLTAWKDGGWILLEFPRIEGKPAAITEAMESAVGRRIVHAQTSDFGFCLAELESEEAVRTLTPNIAAIGQLPYKAVIVTAAGSGAYDFVSRMFAPAMGIPEDPVTGAAHCQLGPYWQMRLEKTDLRAHQASPRGGDVRVIAGGGHVQLGGTAVTVVAGELYDG